MEIATQRIYQKSRGLSVVDELRDQDCLDGVSGGVSGVTNHDYNYMEEMILESDQKGKSRFDSVYVFWKGKSVKLSFLSFGSEKELQRVCKNIYRYDAPYYLSGNKGKVIADDKEGNRITVARPPFHISWMFHVRMFKSVKNLTVEELIKDKGCEMVINTIKYTMLGSVVGVIGSFGTGKTTLLKAIVRFMDPTLNIRVEEDVFETNLQNIYPRRNIESFRKTDLISMEDGLVFTKKTDADAIILGEISEQPLAAVLMQITEICKQSMFSSHQYDPDSLIEYFRNAGLATRMFNSEEVAEEQAVKAIQWVYHTEKKRGGHRFVDRISEIIPKDKELFSKDISLKAAIIKACEKNFW